ncbi:unnamed protein product [Moneuplotes crassus]|uniref:Uncharacterized protein n=1 Tax=Euplotes crassus TaxID=5936 RepID=A0AAD1UR93_EUPCR|nr:unnamed protein product [Moneuplotes crassus]
MSKNILPKANLRCRRTRNNYLTEARERVLKSVPVNRSFLDRGFRSGGVCRKRKILSNMRSRIRPIRVSRDPSTERNISPWKWKESRANKIQMINHTIEKAKIDHWKTQLTDVKLQHIDCFSERETNLSVINYNVNKRISETAMKLENSSDSSSDCPVNSKKNSKFSVTQTRRKKPVKKNISEVPSVFTNMDMSTNVNTNMNNFDKKIHVPSDKPNVVKALNLAKRRCKYKCAKLKIGSIKNFSPNSQQSINHMIQDVLSRTNIKPKAQNNPLKIETYEKISLRKDKKAWSTYRNMKKKTTYPVKESTIPYEILFNPDIDEVRNEEMIQNQKVKPITFHIEETDGGKNVKYEVEGGGKIFETMVVRQNEEVFFNFLNDFSSNKSQLKKMKTRIEQLQRRGTKKMNTFRSGLRHISPVKQFSGLLPPSASSVSPHKHRISHFQHSSRVIQPIPKLKTFASRQSVGSRESQDYSFSPIKVTAPKLSDTEKEPEKPKGGLKKKLSRSFRGSRNFEDSSVSSNRDSLSCRSSIISLKITHCEAKEEPPVSMGRSKDLEIVDESEPSSESSSSSGSDSENLHIGVSSKNHNLTVKPNKHPRKSQSKKVSLVGLLRNGIQRSASPCQKEVPLKKSSCLVKSTRKVPQRLSAQKKRSIFMNKMRSVGMSKIQEGVKLEKKGSEFTIKKGNQNKFRVQIPKNIMFKKYQSIIQEMGNGKQSRMSTIRDHSVTSEEDDIVSAINQAQDPKTGMFFFDIENPNKIIQRVLQPKKEKKKVLKKNIIDQSLKPKYGAKWYITPKNWNKTYKDELSKKDKTEEVEKKEKLKTNSTLHKLIETHKLSTKKKSQLKKKSEGSFSDASDFETNSKDSIENFEDQMMKVIDKEK